MFKKSLTAIVAALTLAGATVTPTAPAQAGSLGRFIAAGIVGAVVGSVIASKARSEPSFRPAYRPGHGVDEDCGFVLRPVFDEFGRKVGVRKVPEC